MSSRYGPPVFTENHSGEMLGNALSNAATTFVNRKRQKTQDQEHQRGSDIADYSAGYRATVPFDEQPGNRPAISGERAMGDPAMQDLATHLMGNLHPAQAPAPKSSAPTGPALASAFETPGAAGDTNVSPASAPGAPSDPGPLPSPEMAATGRQPGAFDPTTKSFGSSSLAGVISRSTTPQRYVSLPHGGYIDTEATPRAESARDRALQLRLAEEFRSRDLAQRGSQATTIEGMRENAAGQRAESAEEARARLSAAHDKRMVDRVRAGEKPTMIGGNPYFKNEETGAWEPAVDSTGKALTVADVPQRPAKAETPTQAQSADAKKIATVSAQISSTQRQMSAVTAAVNAATYAAPGSPEKRAAETALASLPGLKTRLDSLTKVRDDMAATQQGKSTKAPPVDLPLTQQPVTQEEYDAARAAGWDDAKIEAKYGKLGTNITRKP